MWWIGPSTEPSNLGESLTEFGFVNDELAGMAVDLNTIPQNTSTPAGLEIKRVEDTKTLEKYCRALCVGYEFPDFVGEAYFDLAKSIGLDAQSVFRNYVGLLNGEPVATSSIFLGGGVAGIYNVATIPEARRRGIGANMTLLPLLEARGQGYKAGILQSSSMGLNIYRKLGFREYCQFMSYVWLNQ